MTHAKHEFKERRSLFSIYSDIKILHTGLIVYCLHSLEKIENDINA